MSHYSTVIHIYSSCVTVVSVYRDYLTLKLRSVSGAQLRDLGVCFRASLLLLVGQFSVCYQCLCVPCQLL